MKRKVFNILFALVLVLSVSLVTAVPAEANDVASSTMVFAGSMTDEGGGVYSGVIPMVVGGGFDIYAKEGSLAWFGDDPGSGPVWTSQLIASHDAWPTWNPDTPDWYQYSLKLYEEGGVQKWALRNHPGATASEPWYKVGYERPPCGVPMSGTMDWTHMYAPETDTGSYLPSCSGTPEIPGGAASYGGGPMAWDMDWSWGSEAVPLQYPGFSVSIEPLDGSDYRVTLTPALPVTDIPEYGQIKVAQVPLPFQFWAVKTETLPDGTIITNVIDRIRISPTWLQPPRGLPPGQGPVLVRRQFAQSPVPIDLQDLVWDFDRNIPLPQLPWQPVPEDQPDGSEVPTPPGELLLPIEDPPENGAVLVAYEVMGGGGDVVGHFINEAILETSSPSEIVEVRVNFDLRNDLDIPVTNFELEFLGIQFSCKDIKDAVGFVVGTDPVEPWGANAKHPLIVRHITRTIDRPDGTTKIVEGTEVKWVQRDRPLQPGEVFHGGLAFRLPALIAGSIPPGDPEGVNITVQGYWTIIEKPVPRPIDIKPTSCPNPLNLKSKGVLPVAVLGTADFDVTLIDPETLEIGFFGPGSDPFDPIVPPDKKKIAVEDVATPYTGELVDCSSCTEEGPDGYPDLTLKFDKEDVIEGILERIPNIEDGDCLMLSVRGQHYDGRAFIGSDMVRIINKGKGPAGTALGKGKK
ncbi:hypothetical protein ACFLVX_02330 [Chloroflexota bacterium]